MKEWDNPAYLFKVFELPAASVFVEYRSGTASLSCLRLVGGR